MISKGEQVTTSNCKAWLKSKYDNGQHLVIGDCQKELSNTSQGREDLKFEAIETPETRKS